jgi:hypothetical protein
MVAACLRDLISPKLWVLPFISAMVYSLAGALFMRYTHMQCEMIWKNEGLNNKIHYTAQILIEFSRAHNTAIVPGGVTAILL